MASQQSLSTRAQLLLLPALATAWSTCAFPKVNWLAADVGRGISATHKSVGMGDFTYVGGYSRGNTTIVTSASRTSLTQIGPDDNYAMTITQISSAGTPTNMWRWQSSSNVRAAFSFSFMEPMADGLHLAVGFNIPPGNITLNDGTLLVNDLPESAMREGSRVRIAAAVKFNPSDGSVAWVKTYPSSRGSTVMLASGDSSGNMVRRLL